MFCRDLYISRFGTVWGLIHGRCVSFASFSIMLFSISCCGTTLTLFFTSIFLSLLHLTGWMSFSIHNDSCVWSVSLLPLSSTGSRDCSWFCSKVLAGVVLAPSPPFPHPAPAYSVRPLMNTLSLIFLKHTVYLSTPPWYLVFPFIIIEPDAFQYVHSSSCLCSMTAYSTLFTKAAPMYSLSNSFWPWAVTGGDCRQRRIFLCNFRLFVGELSSDVTASCLRIVETIPAKRDRSTLLRPSVLLITLYPEPFLWTFLAPLWCALVAKAWSVSSVLQVVSGLCEFLLSSHSKVQSLISFSTSANLVSSNGLALPSSNFQSSRYCLHWEIFKSVSPSLVSAEISNRLYFAPSKHN